MSTARRKCSSAMDGRASRNMRTPCLNSEKATFSAMMDLRLGGIRVHREDNTRARARRSTDRTDRSGTASKHACSIALIAVHAFAPASTLDDGLESLGFQLPLGGGSAWVVRVGSDLHAEEFVIARGNDECREFFLLQCLGQRQRVILMHDRRHLQHDRALRN